MGIISNNAFQSTWCHRFALANVRLNSGVRLKALTESEKLFERFCLQQDFSYSRINEGASKSPDYSLTICNQVIIVEIKQIDLNKEEKRVLAQPDEEWSDYDVYHWGIPGERVRKKIKAALPQLKALSSGNLPTLLVLYDNVKFWPELLDEYAIRVAMHGIETAIVSPKVAPEGGAKVIKRWYGHRKQVSEIHCTSLSAIGVLEEKGTKITLDIYHNHYALVPLCKNSLNTSEITQFELENEPTVGFSEWKIT